ncbi:MULTISPECIES: Yip1 family protein [unclassified Methanoregula]|uniref:Yip1 family protein n=1 Tax=unclassified Methanoregula TaxID=2649730 RepID=UPI0009D4DCC1|nr:MULTISPECIES: Yip1 family protein [unclassified Methanoregula]OPX62891.1 MAG: Yip1 domain protein [Methanoregula sp. PtaB.Bin085]OPY35328.1 MAG: Yip1 domain protein [Methanoregula sp. PtaU1.Bin006]
MAGLWDLVVRPDTFFARVSQEAIDLRPPLAIFAAGALLPGLVYMVIIVAYMVSGSFSSLSVTLQGMMWVFLKCNVSLPLAGWIIMSLWTWGISRGLGGKGSLAATVRDTGYGMMPWTLSIIAFVLLAIMLFVIGFAAPVTTGVMEEYAQTAYDTWTYLGLLFVIWQWYLWTLGVQHTQKFAFGRSAVITGIPVAVYLAFVIAAMASVDVTRMIMTGT